MKSIPFLTACFFLALLSSTTHGQHSLRVRDLQSEWKVLEDGQWKPYENRTATPGTIYFTIDPLKHSGSRLEFEGYRTFSVWLNGGLLLRESDGYVSMDIDSLDALTEGELNIAVHARRGLEFVQTRIVSQVLISEEDTSERRRNDHLVNFSLLVFFILGVYFILLVRSNPRLTLDYFNLVRLVSVQERDESLVMGKITSSFSILVYVFIGLWSSYLLLIISHFAGTLWIVAGDSTIHGLADAFYKWGRITLFLFLAVFAKILLVLLMSRIFDTRESAPVQMLNFFRLLAGMAMLLSTILVFYFMFGTIAQHYYLNLITLSIWLVGLWAVLILIKLLNKSSFTLFHIISYLCASEFFPIIILFRVLFF